MMKQILLLSTPRAVLPLLVLAITLPSSLSSTATASTSTSSFYFDPTTQYPQPSLITSGLLPYLTTKWEHAAHIALLEQAVEDHNAEYVATSSNVVDAISYRRCIALPLDERFDPPVGVFSHGHVDTGDKMSLPRNFWEAIVKSKAEVGGMKERDVLTVVFALLLFCLMCALY